MLNYIAKDKVREAIEKVCKDKNILILYKTDYSVNIEEYIKETNVNFNVIRYFVIDINCISDVQNLFKIISQLKIMYPTIRIIILASYKDNSLLLEQLYQMQIYNLVDTDLTETLEKQLIEALSDKGIQKKQVKTFDKQEQEKILKKNDRKKAINNKIKNIIQFSKRGNTHKNNNVCFFLLEVITKIVKLIIGSLFFILTSIGITVLFNEQLRNLLLQIFSN